ncbi:cbb3-type cytochrome c oxidase N-terminal domain-containing protein [Zhouia sp. PK063]|uniref:cbb3-type cytochrome c oxidase N-terminal domain-containing protein n=1 Tax=Zhouia sp. PK063 TaxID=3373602 RepID=UPI003799E6B9
MRTFASYLRVIIIVALVFMASEYFIDSGDKPAFMVYPEVLLFMLIFTVALIAIEIVVAAMNNIANAILTEEQKKAIAVKKELAKRNIWYKKWYKKLTKSRPIAQEGEIILDHNYDGIQELDNSLPPWWIGLFYATIIFGAVYLIRFEIVGDYNQKQEYEAEVAKAKIAIEEYKKTAKDLVDENTVTQLTDEKDLAAGKAIFQQNCIPCHAQDGGGGIGPNLTDKYWLLGGGIKNVFHTISEGGRDGKGMIAWKQTLKSYERQQVASYVLSLQGTTPAAPKEPQGDLYNDGSENTLPATENKSTEDNNQNSSKTIVQN